MKALQVHPEISSGPGQARMGTEQADWTLVVLRIAILLSGLLCIGLPIACRVFVYPLYFHDYLRVRNSGLWGSDFTWDDRWMSLLFASIFAGVVLGVVGIVLAVWDLRRESKIRRESGHDESRAGGRWQWVFPAGLVCLVAGTVSWISGWNPVCYLGLAGILLALLDARRETGKGLPSSEGESRESGTGKRRSILRAGIVCLVVGTLAQVLWNWIFSLIAYVMATLLVLAGILLLVVLMVASLAKSGRKGHGPGMALLAFSILALLFGLLASGFAFLAFAFTGL